MSAVPVVTAVPGAAWEATLVAELERGRVGVTVVRRCIDLPDLLAVAATGAARAVLLSTDLRRLDRDSLAGLAAAGLAVVGLTAPGDEQAERRLRQLGVEHVLPADAGPETVSATVLAAVRTVAADRSGQLAAPAVADPLAALPVPPPLPLPREEAAPGAGGDGLAPPGGASRRDAGRDTDDDGPSDLAGRIVAVWGPTGAPGRTTLAVNIAAELAGGDAPVLLADADTYGGVVGQALGLLEEAPGLAAAVRLANNGQLDTAALARVCRTVSPRLRVLTGIARADRWPEIRPAGLEVVWSLARTLAAVTVVDCGFSLERDEELSYDTAAPRRNGATLATLAAADVVLAVGSADPVGLQRLVRGLDELREAVPAAPVRVVVNRVRGGVVGPDPQRSIRDALSRFAGVDGVCFVPLDVAACDAALAAGRTLAEASPGSPMRAAIARLAAELQGAATTPRTPGGRRLRRRVRLLG